MRRGRTDRQPGTSLLVWGMAAAAAGVVFFAVVGLVGVAQGQQLTHPQVLALPLVLLLGGLTAATAGGIERLLGSPSLE